MAFSAIYDACVLYPFEIRDVLMTAALTRCFTLYWTEAILDECARNLIADGRATEENMKVMIDGMNSVYPYANIPLADYESLIPVMTNDPKDRHVLAAAVAKKSRRNRHCQFQRLQAGSIRTLWNRGSTSGCIRPARARPRSKKLRG